MLTLCFLEAALNFNNFLPNLNQCEKEQFSKHLSLKKKKSREVSQDICLVSIYKAKNVELRQDL